MRKNSRLPNLQNLGIHLRILLIVNLLAVMAAILLSKQLSEFLPLLAQLSALVQPILLLSMLGLYALYPWLDKLKYWEGVATIILLEIAFTSLIYVFINYFFATNTNQETYRACLLAAIVTAIVLYYFYLQERAYSPRHSRGAFAGFTSAHSPTFFIQ